MKRLLYLGLGIKKQVKTMRPQVGSHSFFSYKEKYHAV